MLEGYLSELGARKTGLEDAKLAMESWYALKMQEEMIVGPEREKYDDLVGAVDTAIREFNSTMGAIKKAIVTCRVIFKILILRRNCFPGTHPGPQMDYMVTNISIL